MLVQPKWDKYQRKLAPNFKEEWVPDQQTLRLTPLTNAFWHTVLPWCDLSILVAGPNERYKGGFVICNQFKVQRKKMSMKQIRDELIKYDANLWYRASSKAKPMPSNYTVMFLFVLFLYSSKEKKYLYTL